MTILSKVVLVTMMTRFGFMKQSNKNVEHVLVRGGLNEEDVRSLIFTNGTASFSPMKVPFTLRDADKQTRNPKTAF